MCDEHSSVRYLRPATTTPFHNVLGAGFQEQNATMWEIANRNKAVPACRDRCSTWEFGYWDGGGPAGEVAGDSRTPL